MRLISCHIVNFGCLSDRSYTFDPGLNVLYAENGSGKTTLMAFIKAMLYGLPGNAKQKITENDRRRYTPWNKGKFGGSLSFAVGGKEYRVERFFGAREREDTFRLYNLATGKESEDYDESLGERIFAVDAEGFERSLFITQGATYSELKNNTIRARLGEILEASDDLGDFDEAHKSLDGAVKSYQTIGKKGRLFELERAIQQKSEEIAFAEAAKANAERLLNEIASLKEEQREVSLAIARAEEGRRTAEKRKRLEEMGIAYRRLSDALKSANEAHAALLSFFGEHIPSEEEMKEAEDALLRLESSEAQSTLCRLSDEERQTFALLKEIYGESAEDEAQTLSSVYSEYVAARAVLDEGQRESDAELVSLSVHFEGGIPSDEVINAIHEATAAYDDAEAAFLTEGDRQAARRAPKPITLLFAALGLFSLVAALVGFLLPMMALAVTAAVLTVLFAALLVVSLKRREPAAPRSADLLQRARSELSSLLLPFRYEEKSPSLAAKLLFTDLARYRRLCKEREEQRARLEAARDVLRASAEALDEAMKKRAFVGTYEAFVTETRKDIARLSALFAREESHKRTLLALKASADAERARLSRLFSHYESISTLAPREALDELREKRLLLQEAMTRRKEAQHSLEAFLSESAYDPEQPLPPFEGDGELFAKEAVLLSERRLLLEKQIAARRTEASVEEAVKDTLPHLIAERDALRAELSEARHTHELLTKTRDLLLDAKESLSARYLGGMQSSFGEYLSLLGAADEGYRFSTDLAMTTERLGEKHPIEALSRGEQDMIAFCARLSLTDAIFTAEPPFLMLDDPFVNLDDKTYQNALCLLKALGKKMQIFYTVCCRSRVPEA